MGRAHKGCAIDSDMTLPAEEKTHFYADKTLEYWPDALRKRPEYHQPRMLLKSHASSPRRGIGHLAAAEQDVWGSASATPEDQGNTSL